jgi:hypothetical protein
MWLFPGLVSENQKKIFHKILYWSFQDYSRRMKVKKSGRRTLNFDANFKQSASDKIYTKIYLIMYLNEILFMLELYNFILNLC